MTRILFVMPGLPLTFDHSGAASRCAQNFLGLMNQNIRLHVFRYHGPGRVQNVLNLECISKIAHAAREYAASWQEVEIPSNQPETRWDLLRRVVFDPIEYEFPTCWYLAKALAPALQEVRPNLIWAEHSDSAAAVWCLSRKIPWLYSSHDMKYLIRAIRTKPRNGFDSLLAGISRSSEIRVSRSANQILTGSATEAIRLKQIGCHNVTVIRMVNGNFPELNLDSYPTPDLRIIHLGSLETTANRDGLTTYLSTAHGCTLALCTERGTSIELIIVGDASRIKPSLRELLRQEKIVLRGYVSDLSSMLRPFDIAILPYTQDSGYRTKLPLLMSHAQIIVATRAAVAGSQLPGLEQVCILLDRVDEFPEKIAWLSSHPEERKRLGKASRTFAEKFFNLPAVQSSYTDLLRQLDELPRCKF